MFDDIIWQEKILIWTWVKIANIFKRE